MVENAIITKMFTGLVPISQAKHQITSIVNAADSLDVGKKLKACRKYDSKTKERRDYWGELSLWNDRTTGFLIAEAKKNGVIGHAHTPNQKNTSSCTLQELLGEDSDQAAADISAMAQKLAKPDEQKFEEAVLKVKESGHEVSRAAVLRALAGAHVSKNSGENEWYTPQLYIDAARLAMGGIDLDPASSKAANEIVKAAKFFTADDDGLTQNWSGRVWMNPPYESKLIGLFAEKMAEAVESGSVTACCVLVNNATETKWFQRLAGVSSSICFPAGRVKFWHPERESAPLQGQAVLYAGKDAKAFQKAFKDFGWIGVRRLK